MFHLYIFSLGVILSFHFTLHHAYVFLYLFQQPVYIIAHLLSFPTNSFTVSFLFLLIDFCLHYGSYLTVSLNVCHSDFYIVGYWMICIN